MGFFDEYLKAEYFTTPLLVFYCPNTLKKRENKRGVEREGYFLWAREERKREGGREREWAPFHRPIFFSPSDGCAAKLLPFGHIKKFRRYFKCSDHRTRTYIRTTDIYSSLDETSSLETFENKKPIEENKPQISIGR